MIMGPARPETKNDCAGEAQQQFTRPTDRDFIVSVMGSLLIMDQFME
jgi:hypothetical protein